LVVKSQGIAQDVYAAFDEAATRIEKQLRRYKRRLKDHHASKPDKAALYVAKKYVLQTEKYEELEEEGAPAVIAEKPTAIERLSVREAVMKMDLADLPADVAASVHRLPRLGHKDPFDRMLVWQAICAGRTLVSKDRGLRAYAEHGLKLMW
jgi:hypothetical protein